MANQFQLLTKRCFFPFFMAQFIGAFNDNVFKSSLMLFFVYVGAKHYQYSPQFLVTLAGGLFILPFFLFSAMAGQVADKYQKAGLIQKIKLLELTLMAFASFGFYLKSMTILMTVLFLTGIQAAFLGPVKYAILPEQLPKNELVAGNGLIEASTFFAIVVGTILGGIFIVKPNGEFIISIILISFSLLGWGASLFILPLGQCNLMTKINKNFLFETFRTINLVTKDKPTFLVVLGISWIWLVGATFLSQFPIYTQDIIKGNVQLVNFFLLLFSLGIAAGAIFCNRLFKGKVSAHYLPLSAFFLTLFCLDFVYTSHHFMNHSCDTIVSISSYFQHVYSYRIVADLILIAAACGVFVVPLYSLLQIRSSQEKLSQIISGNNILNALFMTFGALITIILYKLNFSIIGVFFTLAIANLIVFFVTCKLLPRAFTKSVIRTLLALFYRIEVRGLENYTEDDERLLIVANHTSFIDAMLLTVFLPGDHTYAVNASIAKKWWVKLGLNWVNTFPLEPTQPMAIKSLIDYVKKGNRCVIFPEGRLTVTGALMKIYEGPAMIADKAQAKILPICIEGAQYSSFTRLKGKIKFKLFPKIKITITPAQDFVIDPAIVGKQRRNTGGIKLYDIMTNLLFSTSEYQETLFTSLLKARSNHGGKHIIADDAQNHSLNYNRLIISSIILGKKIAKETKRQDCIGLLLPNMTTALIAFFSLQAFGRIPVLLNYSTGTSHVLSACQTSAIKIIYTSKKFIEQAGLSIFVNEMTNQGIKVIYLEDVQKSVSFFDKCRGLLLSPFASLYYRCVNFNLDANSPAVILFTSGSEGKPKGVVLSHKNIQANRFQLASCIDFSAQDIIFNALPLFHSFGLTAGTLLPVLSGMKTFLYPSPLHYRIIPELAYSTNATIFFGTDSFLANYAKYAHGYDFYSLRYVFAGAEKLKDSTYAIWAEKFGIRVFEGYGLTETSPILCTNTPMQNKKGSVGRFLPGVLHKIEKIPGISEGGRLQVKGPNIMLGYLLSTQPGVIQPPEQGWHDTGDIVEEDANGFISIKGRSKRFAKVAGEMVSLTSVETAVYTLWPTYQHAVLSKPDPKKGEQIVLITNKPDAKKEGLVAFFKEQGLSEISLPKEILFIEKIPLLHTGKTDYMGLVNLLSGITK